MAIAVAVMAILGNLGAILESLWQILGIVRLILGSFGDNFGKYWSHIVAILALFGRKKKKLTPAGKS